MATSPFTPFSVLLIPPYNILCGTSVSDSLLIHACRALYLVAPWSKKLVFWSWLLTCHLHGWSPLQFFCCGVCASSEVFVFLACLPMLTKAGGLLPVFFCKATHLQAFEEKLGKKQINRRRVEKQEDGETRNAGPSKSASCQSRPIGACESQCSTRNCGLLANTWHTCWQPHYLYSILTACFV